MDFANVSCPSCRKPVVQPINLICNHHLCYRCAEKLLALDSESFEKKYKVSCPACRKNTITYDLRHLIISHTEYDEDLFVTTKYLNQKSEVRPKSPYSKPNDDIESLIAKYQQTKKSQPSSITKQRIPEQYPSCLLHPTSPLKYYCTSDKSLVCNECLRYHKDHHLGDIHVYQEVIKFDVQKIRDDLKGRLSDIKKGILTGNDYKKTLQQEMETLQTSLDHDFGVLKLEVERKYDELSRNIREIYSSKVDEQHVYLEQLGDAMKAVTEFCNFPLNDLASQLKFYSTCEIKLKGIRADIQPPIKSLGYTWQKDIEGIEEGLQRFMKLKEGNPNHHRNKSGNNLIGGHTVSAMIEISRKGSVCEDDVLRAGNKSKQHKYTTDSKRFKL